MTSSYHMLRIAVTANRGMFVRPLAKDPGTVAGQTAIAGDFLN